MVKSFVQEWLASTLFHKTRSPATQFKENSMNFATTIIIPSLPLHTKWQTSPCAFLASALKKTIDLLPSL